MVREHIWRDVPENSLVTRALGNTRAFSPPLMTGIDQIGLMMDIVTISLEET